MQRRDCCRTMVAAVGGGGVAVSQRLPAMAQVSGPATAAIAEISPLQAAFHRAKTAQDIELMLSWWDRPATLKVAGDPTSPSVGAERLRDVWLQSGSFKNRRFSLVPSFKTRLSVRDTAASLYVECHDVADYDQTTRTIMNNTCLAGTLRRMGGHWVFSDMSAGPSTPLSLDRYYA